MPKNAQRNGPQRSNKCVIPTGGVMGLLPSQGPSNHFPWKPHPSLCHPERTRISYFTALSNATYVVLPKENHMQLTEAATLDRKSGEAEGSAVPRIYLGNAQHHAQTELSSRLPRRAVGPKRTRISCHEALDKTTDR